MHSDKMGDAASEANLAKHLAAESIQTMFRRYLECRDLMKIRKMRSTENMVKNLAAETITKSIRSLSRSRSRLHSEVSSVQHGEGDSLASRSLHEVKVRANIPVPPPTGQRDTRILQIEGLIVENVAGVVWQGRNNLYCTLKFMQWEHKTVTIPEAADTASWLDETIDLPMLHNGYDHTKPVGSLSVCIYHENLVVVDKLIAQVDIPLISIFEGEISSPQYICEDPVSVEQTAFDGTKFKKKARGVVKFSARIVHANFDASTNRTKLWQSPSHAARDNLEIRLDSISDSLITHSVDPDNLRDDSMYDFSSTQLREAVNILQEWEAPPASRGIAATGAPTRTPSHPPIRPLSRPSSTRSVKHGAGGNGFHDPPKATTPAETPAREPSAARRSIITPTHKPTTPPVSRIIPADATKEVSVSAKRTLRVDTKGLVESSAAAVSSTTSGNPLSQTAPAAILRPATNSNNNSNNNSTANSINNNTSKPATRVRNRRANGEDSAYNSDTGGGGGNESATACDDTTRRVRRGSGDNSATENGLSLRKPKPSTDATNNAPAGRPPSSSSSSSSRRQKYGEHVIDEAFRLAMKAKGAFLKVTLVELANLLDFLNFPVQPHLLDKSIPISNLKNNDDRVTCSVAAVTSGNKVSDRSVEVSVPVVHAMSLAATISFLVRDHSLLLPSHADSSVGVMNEERSERVLAQLVGLVEGSYPDAKNFILRACVCERAPAKTVSSSVADPQPEPCRPASWSAAVVRNLLRTINVVCAGEGGEGEELTGQQLLNLNSAAIKRHFGANPSIDRTRLYVYLQTIQYIDTWWDRGIRPGELYQKDSATDPDPDDPFAKSNNISSKRTKGKRRGSKLGNDSVSAKWGDLSALLTSLDDIGLAEAVRARSKMVDGGRAIQSHLLQIADFQVLLEALTPLNRAFGWGCALESLVRFASIVGGMRGHLWVHDESVPRGLHSAASASASANSSCADLSQASGFDEATASAQDAIGRWVVLQKGSANSTSELTQLVRLCQELRVVIKYTSREDDFIAFIPLPCLRITSVQEVREGVFQAALEGLLLEDISVGKKVVIAGIDALTRTCERFEWWDRPPAPVLQGMSHQMGEVISLAEAQSKRRVGVRIFGSGLCDALPLEALRLCSEEEYDQRIQSIETKKEKEKETADQGGGGDVSDFANEKETTRQPVRRKSRVRNGESRKIRSRTVVKNSLPPRADSPPQQKVPSIPNIVRKVHSSSSKQNLHVFDELNHKSELSNLSGDELTPPPPARTSPSKKKKLTVPLSTTIISPPKRIIKRVMVRNEPPALSRSTSDERLILDYPPPTGDQSGLPPDPHINYARSAASSAVIHSSSSRAKAASPSDQSTAWSEIEAPAIDYSWMKKAPRSPLEFSEEVGSPPAPLDRQSTEEVRRPSANERRPGTATAMATASVNGPAALHVIQAGFDADHAEYTHGVPKVRLQVDTGEENAGPQKDRLSSKFVRTSRPQSAPSAAGRPKSTSKAAQKDKGDPLLSAEAHSSFGLSGMGYVGGGHLSQHPNQWVNEDIPVFSEAEIPRVIPNKKSIQHTDYRTDTNKLFEFNKKKLPSELEPAATAGGNQHFGNVADVMAAQKEALSPARKTVIVPAQRPRSAASTGGTGTGRGVSNPHHAGIGKTLGEVLGGDFEFPEGKQPPAAISPTQSNPPTKRTREEQLRHIAAAKSAKDIDLQEKVLLRELKRLQKTDK